MKLVNLRHLITSKLHKNAYVSYWLWVLFGFDNDYDITPNAGVMHDYNSIVLRIVLEKTGVGRDRLSWDHQNRLLLDDRRICRRDWLLHPFATDGISYEGASWEEFATQDGHYYAAWILHPTKAGIS